MSEGHSEERPGEGGAIPADPEPNPPAAADSQRRQPAYRRAVLWLAVLLILFVAGVGLSPFWAPDVAPLLPWGAPTGPAAGDYAALAARVAAVEKRPVPPSVDVDAVKSASSGLGRRVDQIETAVNARLAEIEKRPASPSIDVDAIKSAETALGRRVDQLEAARTEDDARIAAAAASTKTALQQLEQRLVAAETRSSSQAASETDAALAMVLLRIHEAVDEARPFPAEYSALKALTRNPDLAANAAPLAEAAQNGVASRAVLSKRLADLAGQIVATEPVTETDWSAQALARLRRLVTIRRIDGVSETGPGAAVSGAQAALARGDLADAVAALDALTGASAEAARPWLRMARERLVVETALDRLQQQLGARLGDSHVAPAAVPAEPALKARTPS